MEPWRAYQEEAAAHFRSLGMSAETDASLVGVRTGHNVDVAVSFRRAGMDFLWVVECKHHARRISKDRVLALRAIVDDLGADRGVLLAENGFQSGAVAASAGTNVVVTSLQELRAASMDEVRELELEQLGHRIEGVQAALYARGSHRRTKSGLTSRVPSPPKELWPTGHLGLLSALSLLERGVKQARAGHYPAAFGWDEDGERPLRAMRGQYVEQASRLLTRIEKVVEGLPHLEDRS